MPTNYKGRCFLTEQQKQQLNEGYDYLRELHRDAYFGLRQIGRATHTDKRADDSLGRTADEISGALKILVEISSSAQEQVLPLVFEVSFVCSNCPVPRDETKDNPDTTVPFPDLAHLPELDHLLDFANKTGRRRARKMRHNNSNGIVFAGHKKLVNALIKERRHLRETDAPSPSPIELRVNGPDCSVCHQPPRVIEDPMKNQKS